MSKEKKEIEYSEELRALALRFFSFTEQVRSERTKDYMEWSMLLKTQIEHLQEMLDTMGKCESFNRISSPDFPKNDHQHLGNIGSYVRGKLNQYSSEELFSHLKQQAVRGSFWKRDHCRTPNAEAAAWLAYFTIWDPDKSVGYGRKGDFVPNENWHCYYREHFGSKVENEKPKRRTRKKKN